MLRARHPPCKPAYECTHARHCTRGDCFPSFVKGVTCRRLPSTADNRAPSMLLSPPNATSGAKEPQREHDSSTATLAKDGPKETTAAAAQGLQGGGAKGDDSVSPRPNPGSQSSRLSGSATAAASAGVEVGTKDHGVWQEEEDHDAFRELGAAARPGKREASESATSNVSEQPLPAFNFSFAMGGWLMFYSFGVAKCLLDHGLHKVSKKQSAIGSSAGSLAAAALVLEADIDKVIRTA